MNRLFSKIVSTIFTSKPTIQSTKEDQVSQHVENDNAVEFSFDSVSKPYLTEDKTNPPSFKAANPPVSISEHINKLKTLTNVSEKTDSTFGMGDVIGHESSYCASASFVFEGCVIDRVREVSKFIQEKHEKLLSAEELSHDSCMISVGSSLDSPVVFRVIHTRYTTLSKYFDIFIEANKQFGLNCERWMTVELTRTDGSNGKLIVPAICILNLDDGYHEMVSLEYLVSLHRK